MKVIRRLTTASNASFLAELDGQMVIYKPVLGERPLWDFPSGGLAQREVATFRVSQALGWDLVPRTELVEGPLGLGSVQTWVEGRPLGLEVTGPDEDLAGWTKSITGEDQFGNPVILWHETHHLLVTTALFDALINNTDRKASHVLITQDNGIALIDHGVTFSADPKLRTVLWGWAGTEIPAELIGKLRNLDLTEVVQDLLRVEEIAALSDRQQELLSTQLFPQPSAEWPALPWPLA